MGAIYKWVGVGVVAVGFAVAGFAAQAKTVVVTVNGISYALKSVELEYTGNEALFAAQPWWNNEPLAFAISNALLYQLGDLDGGPGTSPGIPAALVAYGTLSGFVSITYWDGTAVVNCPGGCPAVDSEFFYVEGSVVNSQIPTLSEWGLIILSVLTGLIGLVATGRVLRRPA
jgi:hypothetical protein